MATSGLDYDTINLHEIVISSAFTFITRPFPYRRVMKVIDFNYSWVSLSVFFLCCLQDIQYS